MIHGQRDTALNQAARQFGIELTDDAKGKLTIYIDTLLHWRTRISLTAAATASEIIEQHLADSLAVAPHLPNNIQMADIGSGAGFPGIVVAIARPDVHVVLVESRRKRASFLQEVVRQAAIKNAEVIEARAEDLPKRWVAYFDVITSRAFGPLPDFLSLSAPWLRAGAVAIAMKGPKGRDEAQAYVGFSGPEVAKYSLANLGERILLKYIRT